jgi:tRNA pseudouridine38-40 synthase
MRNIKLIIEYDGTYYHGWQSQINAVAIQDVVESAIRKITSEVVKVTGSSRTDVGVHAYGQVANFVTCSRIPADRFSYALNSILPDDICIKSSSEVDRDFHSRYDAKGKKYKYLILNAGSRSALLRNRAFHVPAALDVAYMEKAAEYLIGSHDFSSFMASGSSVKSTVRSIYEVGLKKDGDLITFEISGDGFLYNMVRIIAGTLVEIGQGKKSPQSMCEIIDAKNRKCAGKTAPAHGLYLVEVYYS